MKRKINLYWYKHKEGHGNFGDELNHYIVKRLTNLEVNHIDIHWLKLDFILFLKVITSSLIKNDLSLLKYFKYLYYYFVKKPNVLIGIGSVLGGVSSRNYIVWGSGIISRNDTFKNANFKAVRGKFSQKRIEELGYKPPKVIGDPALLLPLIYKPSQKKRYDVSIIPHFIHYDEYKNKIGSKFNIINLTDNIEHIIDQINQSELTISTSLHGIIVSHAYGVKSLRAEDLQRKLTGDDIKFLDYYSSVNIENYKPLDSNELFIKEKEELLNIVNSLYSSVLTPQKIKIVEIQKKLIEVFPYKLKNNL